MEVPVIIKGILTIIGAIELFPVSGDQFDNFLKETTSITCSLI
jgi:hypothetical protein